MKKVLTVISLAIALTSVCAQSREGDATNASEKEMLRSLADAKIVAIRKEIPKIEKELKKSRRDYQKRIATLPKDGILVCGDWRSTLLEEQLARKREALKIFEEERKGERKPSEIKKTEQAAAANP